MGGIDVEHLVNRRCRLEDDCAALDDVWHLHELVGVVASVELSDFARGRVEREVAVLDVDQLEILVHKGGTQEHGGAAVHDDEIKENGLILVFVQEDGGVLDSAEDGGPAVAVGALEGDGLGSEEWASGTLEIVANECVYLPGDAVCLCGGVELGDGEPECSVPGSDPKGVRGSCGGDDVLCCRGGGPQSGGLGVDVGIR